MRDTLSISDLRFLRAPLRLQATGLHGWVTLTVENQLDIGYVAVRTTAEGRDSLSFPTRTDAANQKHTIVRPLDQNVRDMIERRVFAELRARRLIP